MANKQMKDKVKRDSWGKCIRCGDTAITKSGDCFYCNWKGYTGKGALLKTIAKGIKNA